MHLNFEQYLEDTVFSSQLLTVHAVWELTMTWQLPTDRKFRFMTRQQSSSVCLPLVQQSVPVVISTWHTCKKVTISWSRDLESKLLIRKNKSMVFRRIWNIAFFWKVLSHYIQNLTLRQMKGVNHCDYYQQRLEACL